MTDHDAGLGEYAVLLAKSCCTLHDASKMMAATYHWCVRRLKCCKTVWLPGNHAILVWYSAQARVLGIALG